MLLGRVANHYYAFRAVFLRATMLWQKDDHRSAPRARNGCEADGHLITADAGMGVDSSLPEFRGAEASGLAYPAKPYLYRFGTMTNARRLIYSVSGEGSLSIIA